MNEFKTQTMCDLYEEIGALSDAEHPFLDPRFPSNSFTPICDMTPYVTEFLVHGDLDSVRELWGYLAGANGMHAFEQALAMPPPVGIEISTSGICEIRAALILGQRPHLRRQGAAFAAALVAATALSTRKAGIARVLRFEVTKNLSAEDAETAFAALERGTESCATFAGTMKQLPPMVRVAISNAIRDAEPAEPGAPLKLRTIPYSLGAGERAWGCSADIGHSLEESGALDTVIQMEGANATVRAPFVEEALAWNARQRALIPLADALLTCLGDCAQRINVLEASENAEIDKAIRELKFH